VLIHRLKEEAQKMHQFVSHHTLKIRGVSNHGLIKYLLIKSDGGKQAGSLGITGSASSVLNRHSTYLDAGLNGSAR
jgi:hypothetical protein